MKNARWRDRGATDAVAPVVRETSLGLLLVASTARGVCALRFGDDRAELDAWLARVCPHAGRRAADAAAETAADIACAWTETPRDAAPAPALDIRGADFQMRAWAALQAIPMGETRTYSQIAATAGSPAAVRAAGGACANNLISLFVPCHRVVHRTGGLAGYAWGLRVKETLLARERGDLSPPPPVQMSMRLKPD